MDVGETTGGLGYLACDAGVRERTFQGDDAPFEFVNALSQVAVRASEECDAGQCRLSILGA